MEGREEDRGFTPSGYVTATDYGNQVIKATKR